LLPGPGKVEFQDVRFEYVRTRVLLPHIYRGTRKVTPLPGLRGGKTTARFAAEVMGADIRRDPIMGSLSPGLIHLPFDAQSAW